MKFWEAMREYEAGRSVRCKEWHPGHWMNKEKDNTSVFDRQQFWFCKDLEWEFLEDHMKVLRSQIGTVGGFRYLKSDGTIGHLKDGETMEMPNGNQ